jgi:hypothetical protein
MKIFQQINGLMLEFRNNSFPLPSSAARERQVAQDCQVSFGPRLSCALLDYVVSPVPSTEVRVLVFDASMRFTSGGYSRGHMFWQADTALRTISRRLRPSYAVLPAVFLLKLEQAE